LATLDKRMNIKIHRIYDDDVPQGYHALVDRLWPRGVSKEKADLMGGTGGGPGGGAARPGLLRRGGLTGVQIQSFNNSRRIFSNDIDGIEPLMTRVPELPRASPAPGRRHAGLGLWH